MRRVAMLFVTSFAACGALLVSARADAPDPETAKELAKRLYDAKEAGRFDEVVATLRPEDVEDWKTKTLERWEALEAIGQGKVYEFTFPERSREEVAALSAAEALKLSHEASHAREARVPSPRRGFRVVGTLQEEDVTHVAALIDGRFDLLPCYRTDDGGLRMGVGATEAARLRTDLIVAKLQAQKVPPSEFQERMRKLAVPVEARILAIFKAEEPVLGDSLWIVGRGKFRGEGGEEYDILGITPVGDRHPLRELLDPDDPTKLDDERRAMVEEAFWNSEKRARAPKE